MLILFIYKIDNGWLHNVYWAFRKSIINKYFNLIKLMEMSEVHDKEVDA